MTNETAEPTQSPETAAPTTAANPTPKTSRKSKGPRSPIDGSARDILLAECRPVTFAVLDRIERAWEAWAELSAGENPKKFAGAKADLYSLVVEFIPGMLPLARNTLKGRQR
jgi:hypothetical protein